MVRLLMLRILQVSLWFLFRFRCAMRER
uniref:Uncharacterized protein n=1 Tax=Rhizophora mucronata TaxID=61149 RepID=A0A2P2NE06_RHIMU